MSSPTRRAVLVSTLLVPALLSPGGALAQDLAAAFGLGPPEARLLGPRWAVQGDGAGPDADDYAALLERHLSRGADGIARFDYAAARAERPALAAFIARLEATDPATLAPAVWFGFWADLYNALTLELMLEAWPVDSIRTVQGGLFSSGPWKRKLAVVAGADLSLDDIEHGILRPVTGDARVHYAVNCAALGCPDLAARPWLEVAREGGLDAALDAAARAFVNHPRGVRTKGGTLATSSIYHWFREDFGGTDAGVIAHLAQHAEPELRAALAGVRRVDGHAYDWAVNAP